MTRLLSQETVDRYQETGILFPVPIFTPAEVEQLQSNFEALEARDGGRLRPMTNRKPYLLVSWINELVRHPKLLDAIEDIIGPNIMVWSAQFFAKKAGDPDFISWHQDGTYWGLSSPEVVSAWIAFTPSTVASGCMRVVPGSHRAQVEHRDTFDPNNMLSRGQEVAVEVREEDAMDVVLQPGEVSLHNVLIVHGSNPNKSHHARVGFAVRFLPPHLKQTLAERDSALLVRGVDTHGHFDHEQPPEGDFHPDAVRRHAKVIARQTALYFAGAKQSGKSASLVPGIQGVLSTESASAPGVAPQLASQ